MKLLDIDFISVLPDGSMYGEGKLGGYNRVQNMVFDEVYDKVDGCEDHKLKIDVKVCADAILSEDH